MNSFPLNDPKKMGWRKLTWIFTFACMFGVALEVGWCFFMYGSTQSRTGLLFGPFNPVYGFGTILFTLCFGGRQHRPLWLLFLEASAVGGLFEYGCSLLQEWVLGTVSWNYTGHPLVIGPGRTTVLYAAGWGLLGVLWIRLVYPPLSRLMARIPHKAGSLAAAVLLLFMVFNMTVSFMAVYRQSRRRLGTAKPTAIGRLLDEKWPDEVLREIYPSMEPAEGFEQRGRL